MRRSMTVMVLLGAALGLLPVAGYSENAIYLFGGECHTQPHRLTVSQPALGNYLEIDDVEFTDESYVGPIYYGFRFSHFFEKYPYLGLELEFFHPKASAITDQDYFARGEWHHKQINREIRLHDYVQEFEVSHGFNFLLLNLAGRYGFFKTDKVPYGRLQLIGRIGAGPTILHPESNIDHHTYFIETGGYEFGDIGLQISPAIEFNIWRGINGFAEYKYTYTEIDDINIRYGEASTVFETQHYAFGLSYHFK